MDELRGKFITTAGFAMAYYKDEQAKADAWIKSKVGVSFQDLDPDGWYDLEIFIKFLEIYATASPTGDLAYVTMGEQVFPTVKRAGVLPPELSKPIDFLKFEFDLYLLSLRGPNIHPRKLLQETDGDVRIEVRNPPYKPFDILMEGVFLGAAVMGGADASSAKVEQTKCVHKGDSVCEYKITW